MRLPQNSESGARLTFPTGSSESSPRVALAYVSASSRKGHPMLLMGFRLGR